jgi:ferredoxin--NADP+ reductase
MLAYTSMPVVTFRAASAFRCTRRLRLRNLRRHSFAFIASTNQYKSLREPVAAKELEGIPVPLNTYGIGKAGKNPPFIGEVLSIKRLGGRDKERDVSHIVIGTGGVQFVEGQSFGVKPPGTKVTTKGKSFRGNVFPAGNLTDSAAHA